jgi:hypothetical protein
MPVVFDGMSFNNIYAKNVYVCKCFNLNN